jgi:hypothetical protein
MVAGPGIVRLRPYWPTNPQTTAQQTRRTVFANGIAEWQSLTSEQKAVYNKSGTKVGRTGMNLFMREWLKSH